VLTLVNPHIERSRYSQQGGDTYASNEKPGENRKEKKDETPGRE